MLPGLLSPPQYSQCARQPRSRARALTRERESLQVDGENLKRGRGLVYRSILPGEYLAVAQFRGKFARVRRGILVKERVRVSIVSY